MAAFTWCGRGTLWILLTVLLILGIAAAAMGGAQIGTANLINTGSLEFAQAVLLLIGGLLMILSAIMLVVGACGGSRKGLLTSKVFILLALLAMLGAAICGTIAYTRFNADPAGSAQSVWNNLIPGAQGQYQALVGCQGWLSVPGAPIPGCAESFTNNAYYTIYGAMIGSWVCVAILALCLAIAYCTWRNLRNDKRQLQEAADAEKAAAVATAAAKPVYVQAAPSPVYATQPSGSPIYATQTSGSPVYATQPSVVATQPAVYQSQTSGLYATQPATGISTGTVAPQPTQLYTTTSPSTTVLPNTTY